MADLGGGERPLGVDGVGEAAQSGHRPGIEHEGVAVDAARR